jgi:hypothetical protein
MKHVLNPKVLESTDTRKSTQNPNGSGKRLTRSFYPLFMPSHIYMVPYVQLLQIVLRIGTTKPYKNANNNQPHQLRFNILAVVAILTVATTACNYKAYKHCLTLPSGCEIEGRTPAECAGQWVPFLIKTALYTWVANWIMPNRHRTIDFHFQNYVFWFWTFSLELECQSANGQSDCGCDYKAHKACLKLPSGCRWKEAHRPSVLASKCRCVDAPQNPNLLINVHQRRRRKFLAS